MRCLRSDFFLSNKLATYSFCKQSSRAMDTDPSQLPMHPQLKPSTAAHQPLSVQTSQQQQQQQQQQMQRPQAPNTSQTQTMKPSSSSCSTNARLLPRAPLLAPKPPINISSGGNTGSTNVGNANTGIKGHLGSSPGIMTSKQWILPPRPKAGRKPSMSSVTSSVSASTVTSSSTITTAMANIHSKTNTNNNSNAGNLAVAHKVHNTTTTTNNNNNNNNNNNDTKGGFNGGNNGNTTSRKNSMNSLSNNVSNLKISNYESKKNELELATEENLKLKNIISRLKIEIDSLKNDLNVGHAGNGVPGFDVNGMGVDSSPTINPIIISQNMNNNIIGAGDNMEGKKKVKRTYKKKIKKSPVPEDSPSPISLNELNNHVKVGDYDIPNIDEILNNGNNNDNEVKKKKVKAPKAPKIPKIPKAPKVPKKKKDAFIKVKDENEHNTVIPPSVFQPNESVNSLGVKPISLTATTTTTTTATTATTINDPYMTFSSAFHSHLSTPPPSSSSGFSSLNSPGVAGMSSHHPFNSIQLSRTTTMNTMGTIDTLDTVDTLGTFDTFDDLRDLRDLRDDADITGTGSWIDDDDNNNGVNSSAVAASSAMAGRGVFGEKFEHGVDLTRNDDHDGEKMFLEIDESNDLDINVFV